MLNKSSLCFCPYLIVLLLWSVDENGDSPSLSLLISVDCPRISVSGLPSPRIPAEIADFIKNKTRWSKSVLNILKRSAVRFLQFPLRCQWWAEFSCFVIAAFATAAAAAAAAADAWTAKSNPTLAGQHTFDTVAGTSRIMNFKCN